MLWSSFLCMGSKGQGGEAKAHSLAAGKGYSRVVNSGLPGSRILAFPLAEALRRPEGFHMGLLRRKWKKRVWGRGFKMEVLLFRYDEANRTGDDCHWKESLLLKVPKRRGPAHHAGPHGKHQDWSGGKRRRRKMWARALIVISRGGNRWDKVSRLRIG